MMILNGILFGLIILLCLRLSNVIEENIHLERLLKDKNDLINIQDEVIKQLLEDEAK